MRMREMSVRSAIVGAAILLSAKGVVADVPRFLQYQGKLLTDTGAFLSGPVDVRVRLYHHPTATSPVVFDETHNNVALNKGLFVLLIGGNTMGGVPDSAVDAPEVYLGVTIGTGAELTPRRRVVSSTYAVKSRAAERLVKGNTLETALSADSEGRLSVGGATPDPSAILDLATTNRGFLPPRVTTAERTAISSPAAGLVVFNTTTNCLEFFVSGVWQQVACGCTAPPDIPGTISGSPFFFAGGSGFSYSIAPVFGADSYTWAAPPDSTITSGQGTPSITVTFGPTTGSITVYAVNGCGNSADRTLNLTGPGSCQDIKTGIPSSVDGTYSIDPDGAGGSAPFDAYCDMTSDGGGWTLVAIVKNDYNHVNTSAVGTVSSPGQGGAGAKLSDAAINLLGTEYYRFTCDGYTDYFDPQQRPFSAVGCSASAVSRSKDTYASTTWVIGGEASHRGGLNSFDNGSFPGVIYGHPQSCAGPQTGCYTNATNGQKSGIMYAR